MVDVRTMVSVRGSSGEQHPDALNHDHVAQFFPHYQVFEIGEERYFLVEETCWLATKLEKPVEIGLRARICGYIGIGAARHVVLESVKASPCQSSCISVLQLLTRRELEIAELIAGGLGNKEIGCRLGISYFTVREHVRRVAQKLQVSSRSAIAAHVGHSVVVRGK